MAEKVWDSPEIYRIPVDLPQNPLRTLNCYVVRSGGCSLVIDTGFNRPECRAALWQGLEELKLDPAKTALFLTHFHADHSGLAWDFVSKGIPIYMGRVDYAYFSTFSGDSIFEETDCRFVREGYPVQEIARQGSENQARLYAADKSFPVVTLEDGQEITIGTVTAMAICTPGHTPGHMVLYLPAEQILFSGDHILFDITPNIAVWPHIRNPLSQYIASLLKISRLPIRVVLPAHRAGNKDMRTRINQIIEHHGNRLNEIYRAVKMRPGSTAFQIAGAISWSVRGLAWESFPPHQKWFAMAETLAHLDYLTDKGQLLRATNGDYVCYCLCRCGEV